MVEGKMKSMIYYRLCDTFSFEVLILKYQELNTGFRQDANLASGSRGHTYIQNTARKEVLMMLITPQKQRMKYRDRRRKKTELKVSVEESRPPFRGREKLSQKRKLIHRAQEVQFSW